MSHLFDPSRTEALASQPSVDHTSWWATAFLATAIFVPGHMFKWAIEWLWLAGTLAIGTLFALNAPRGRTIAGVSTTIWLALFGTMSLSSAASVGFSVLVRQLPIEPRDISELVRFPFYAVLGVIVGTIGPHLSESAVERTLRILLWFVLMASALFIVRVPVLSPLLTDVIYRDAKTLVGVAVIRVSIPFENPNYLGFFGIFVLTYFGFFRRSTLYVALLIVVIFLTGSRSAWIAALPLLLGCFAVAIWRYSFHEIGLRTLASWLSPLLIALALNLFWDKLQYFSRLTELADAVQGGGVSGVKTADVRFNHVAILLDWFARSPILGWGPGRAVALDVADNQYVSWLVNWGILGTAIMVLSVTILLFQLIATSRQLDHFIGTVALSVAVGLMIFTGDFLENYRLYFLMLLMLDILYRQARRDRAVVEAIGLSTQSPPFQSLTAFRLKRRLR